MKAYRNDLTLKTRLLAEIAKHSEQGYFTKPALPGQSVHPFNLCLVESLGVILGRTVELEDVHYTLDVPDPLIHILNSLFHELPTVDRPSWPHRALSAIQVGSDYRSTHVDLLLAVESGKLGPDQEVLNDLHAWRKELWALPGDAFDLRQTYTTRPLSGLNLWGRRSLSNLDDLASDAPTSPGEMFISDLDDPAIEQGYISMASTLLALLESTPGNTV